MIVHSVLTCPACGHAEELAMPTDACLFFHECAACHVRLRPNAGDCCVFCSFGSVPIQSRTGCCAEDADQTQATDLGAPIGVQQRAAACDAAERIVEE
jgi:hypothetical protein